MIEENYCYKNANADRVNKILNYNAIIMRYLRIENIQSEQQLILFLDYRTLRMVYKLAA